MIDADDIKTSFAYKLFKELAEERKLKMTAVTGKIQRELPRAVPWWNTRI